jgi:hypothetical protein
LPPGLARRISSLARSRRALWSCCPVTPGLSGGVFPVPPGKYFSPMKIVAPRPGRVKVSARVVSASEDVRKVYGANGLWYDGRCSRGPCLQHGRSLVGWAFNRLADSSYLPTSPLKSTARIGPTSLSVLSAPIVTGRKQRSVFARTNMISRLLSPPNPREAREARVVKLSPSTNSIQRRSDITRGYTEPEENPRRCNNALQPTARMRSGSFAARLSADRYPGMWGRQAVKERPELSGVFLAGGGI